MAAIKSQHSRVFERLVAVQRQKLVDAILSGNLSHEFYREFVGEIRGLDNALKMSEEADFKLSGDFDVNGA